MVDVPKNVIALFDELIGRGELIKEACKKIYFAGSKKAIDVQSFEAWRTSCLTLLKSTFGTSSPHYDSFTSLKFFDHYNSTLLFLGILQGARDDLRKGYFYHKDLMLSVNIFNSFLLRGGILPRARRVPEGGGHPGGRGLRIASQARGFRGPSAGSRGRYCRARGGAVPRGGPETGITREELVTSSSSCGTGSRRPATPAASARGASWAQVRLRAARLDDRDRQLGAGARRTLHGGTDRAQELHPPWTQNVQGIRVSTTANPSIGCQSRRGWTCGIRPRSHGAPPGGDEGHVVHDAPGAGGGSRRTGTGIAGFARGQERDRARSVADGHRRPPGSAAG